MQLSIGVGRAATLVGAISCSTLLHAEGPFLHRQSSAMHSAEAVLASYWSRDRRCSLEHAIEFTQPSFALLDSSGATHRSDAAWQADADRLAAAAKKLGIGGSWRTIRSSEAPVSQLSQSLLVWDAAILPGNDPRRWLLAWLRPDGLAIMDPGSPAGGARLETLWRPQSASGSAKSWRWLPLRGRVRDSLPALTAHSHYQYARELSDVRRRAARLVERAAEKRVAQAPFHALVERPFVVVGDAEPKEVQRWASGSVRWAVQRMKAKFFSKNPSQVLEIWLFDGKASYERNVETLFGRKPSTPYGYYSPRNGALVMNIQTGGGTLVHEILHPFMAANFPACPSWFNEGLASLYEQSTERDRQIWGLTNWRLAGLQRAIAADGVPSFEKLCGASTREFYDDRTGVHYAQARYLCYYLQEKGLLETYYRAFKRQHTDDPSGYETLKQVLETERMDVFQRQWKRYVMELRFPE